MAFTPPRQRYIPSGRFDQVRMAVVLLWLIGASAVVAALYEAMLLRGCYFSAISILSPLLVAAGFANRAVRYAHCRSRLLAGALGFACGLFGYLTYFHADQCVRWGAPILAVNRLPGYIVFRMETDQWRWLDKAAVLEPLAPQNAVQPQLPLAGARLLSMSWGLFLFDLGALTLAPLATGIATASRPYSEKQRRWCVCESLFVSKAAGAELRAALRHDSIAEWALSEPERAIEHRPHCKVTLWYVPWDKDTEFDGEVFLSLDGGCRLRLNSAESAAFIGLLPDMQDIVGQALTDDAEPASTDPALTRIWSVPAPYGGPKQTQTQRALERLRNGAITIGPAIAALVALVGGTMLLPLLMVPFWVAPLYV